MIFLFTTHLWRAMGILAMNLPWAKASAFDTPALAGFIKGRFG